MELNQTLGNDVTAKFNHRTEIEVHLYLTHVNLKLLPIINIKTRALEYFGVNFFHLYCLPVKIYIMTRDVCILYNIILHICIYTYIDILRSNINNRVVQLCFLSELSDFSCLKI